MPHRTEVGDFENSILSWVSEHLRETSMTNKVNQHPPTSLEESSPQEKLFEHGEDLGMEVSNSPSMELNIMTQGNNDRLREAYYFPLGVQIRILGNGEMILSAGEDKRYLSLNEFWCLYALLKGLGSESGWLYYRARPGKNILNGPLTMSRGGRRYSSSSRETIGSSIRVFLTNKRSYGFQGHGASDTTKCLPCPRPRTRDFTSRGKMSSSGGSTVEGDIGGGATTSVGDASESHHSRYVPCPDVPSRDDSVEYIGTIGKEMWRILPHRIKLSQLAKTMAEKAAISFTKGVVISEKHPQDEVLESPSKKRAFDDGSKGKQVTPLPEAKKAKTRALAEVSAKEKKAVEEVESRNKEVARLEALVADLEKSQALAKGRIIIEFKESEDYQEALMGSSSSYFGDGFDFCKRTLVHHHPDLGINLDDMEMDQEFLEKEEAKAEEREEEKKED
ncbi:hypothetical protein Acr_28g0002720 [Actinidia rufa]|uniref:Uncharacterized protein n=1 Tax=Actinidia rufa TaxID=165716 RepID=A0A7J0H8Z9_9ERIC|nr:hypothetical protein Acr_28g0002720 [Actinidia rufa]